MDAQKVDMYIVINGKYFESHQLGYIREKLLASDESKWQALLTLQFKEPSIILTASFLGGALGIDRFMVGDTGLGVAKLLTCGGFQIWTIVDWFNMVNRTKEVNFQTLSQVL
ncbi:MAG: TM2 domain-containing protein [Chitinophagales bacterium]|nr:TM2 domain-containing protein [Chitinophagales bacterium]